MNKQNKHFCVFILILGLVLYGNTIGNHYSMDDDFVVVNSEQTAQGGSMFKDIIFSHYSETGGSSFEYRPVSKLSFALDYVLWGDNPHLSHCVNLLLFLITLLVLYKILCLLFAEKYPWLPLISIILFAVHPIHTEVVASLKNRDELLSFLFCLLSALMLMRTAEKRKYLLIIPAVLLYILAYYSKSSALVFAALFPLILYFQNPKNWKFVVGTLVVFLAAAFFARLLPQSFLSESSREVWYFENPLYVQKGFLNRLGLCFTTLIFYLRILFVPYPLRFYYGFDTIPFNPFPDFISVISLIIHLGLLVFAILKLKSRSPLSFAILFYLISISMFANLVRPAVGIVAERFVYCASLGFVVAIAFLLLKICGAENAERKSFKLLPFKFKISFLAICLILGIMTIKRNPVWDTRMSLYENDIVHLSNSFKANMIYANTMQTEVVKTYGHPKYNERNQEYVAEIDQYFKRAIEIYDEYPPIWNNYGSYLFMLKRDIKASLPMFKKAIELKENYPEALFNVGACYDYFKELDSAKYYYQRAIHFDNKYENAYERLGGIYLSSGDTLAFTELQRSHSEADPESDMPYLNMSNLYVAVDDIEKAKECWDKAIVINPENQYALQNLIKYYQISGDVENERLYQKKYDEVLRLQRKKQREQSQL